MAADPSPPDVQSDDLFGRWLAHHEGRSPDDADTSRGGQAPAAAAPEQSAPRRLPTALVASAALERDPMIGTRLQAPSTFGVRRPAANAPQGTGTEPEQAP